MLFLLHKSSRDLQSRAHLGSSKGALLSHCLIHFSWKHGFLALSNQFQDRQNLKSFFFSSKNILTKNKCKHHYVGTLVQTKIYLARNITVKILWYLESDVPQDHLNTVVCIKAHCGRYVWMLAKSWHSKTHSLFTKYDNIHIELSLSISSCRTAQHPTVCNKQLLRFHLEENCCL